MRFGNLLALNSVSFDVAEGEVFGIAGPNGAGKTTLFNVITGFYRGTGKILFGGGEIQGLQPHQICHRGIARTFQLPNIFASLTVYQNIRFGAHFGNPGSPTKDKEIEEILELTELEEKRDLRTRSIDLFAKKKTMLASAVATKPKLLLLDEPIGGLNPDEIDHFLNLIGRVRVELGVTFMIIEHLMEYLMELSDRLMILDFGEKICIGTPSTVARDKRVVEVYLGEGSA
ncbi:MAG: ATP-binding cassette domain-containing protein [Deltaproteobacteria bacterium]|nr:ATP-binding cassette domain-containing protein [Deltaproteobacteria bacterium]MBW2123265.1 ATP-binding cassette domain-containing protein [Deltaproteobacteria bacterium]